SISSEALWRRWLLSPAVRAFESGATEPESFAEAVVKEFCLPVSPSDFLSEFAFWPRALMPGATSLLRELRGRFRLASYSNTNVLHWTHVQSQFDLLEHFDMHFPSHLTGKIKPDEDGFRHIVAALDCSPECILFFDDNPLNVAGARAVGIESVRVDGPADIRRALANYDIYLERSDAELVVSEVGA
ncbi:MAG: HAD-IA family hydrolase, partial [Candidatus Hydrogenedentes bacterium]|nr:HAD-IA family hydrolase [Candidatus Hydrogenedentota bacterium]